MKMSEAAKKRVSKRLRGVPGKSGTGSYPLDTAAHRREAVSLAAMHHGSNSPSTKRIRAKAARISKAGGRLPEKDRSMQGRLKGY